MNSETKTDKQNTEVEQQELLKIENPINVLEALLFVSKTPITVDRFASILPEMDKKDIRSTLEVLQEQYDQQDRPFRIEQIAGGYQMLTRKEYAPWLLRLYRQKRDEKLSPASIEALSIIAYKQPVTRADLEAVRGVGSDHIFRMLLERDMIKVVGREESLGHPIQYGTTKKFLEHFGLNSLKELPKIEDIAKK